ncbi:protein windpipe-like [Macrosteles quadrilineatus]|uniref:protein windpipe-like n=1 Tax=Macrosteles quadrilineatus TaxID=74068 RepID=UPI0023E1B83B|nr:protein windpipe-like [Macrosteles quadrilineatus]
METSSWRLALVLVSVLWLTQACPNHCSCRYEQGLYVANCSTLPPTGGKIESLTLLSSRSPLELMDGQFNMARHLKYLNMRNCSIYYIHKKTFYGAKSVIEVDLSYNQIEELEPTVFQHLSSLTTLILRGNPIQFLPEVPFLISNSLQHLDIGDCKLEHIPRVAFYGLKRLKYLSLDKNLLKSIKYNSLPKGLKYIDISNNLIVNFPTEVISSLTNLRRLGLGGNPINCSCSLLNLQDWLSGRGVIFEDDVICSLPSQYKGVSWSKVDENSLCLAEARKEEMDHYIYSPLFKNRLLRENYYENENAYQGEPIQSDQPQPNSNSDAEVLFQNDDTLAMGEMMRDEDGTSSITEKKGNQEETKVDDVKLDEADSKIEAAEPVSYIENQESTDDGSKTEDDKVLSESQSENVPNKDEKESGSSPETETDLVAEETVNLNYSKPVEFKTLSEDENKESDDLKNEGLIHAEINSLQETNYTEEESTVLPYLEDTTEDEVPSTEETPGLSNTEIEDNEEGSLNVTSTTETNNSTNVEDPAIPDDDVEDTIPPPTTIPDLYSGNDETKTNSSVVVPPVIEPEEPTTTSSDTKEISAITAYKNGNIKQVAGAEVVMFCVGVLIVCLILYSVYRCRNSKKRRTTRIVKDKPSNRDTEMQDMASLLPKPLEDEKKNNSKYPDKAPSSETEKLISNENEKELPTIIPISETKGKKEDKNSINNNTADTSASPTSKTPLIQQGKPITINPAAPIQRTKAKVGILPDSIPRTPIFLQKTYNGTKNV